MPLFRLWFSSLFLFSLGWNIAGISHVPSRVGNRFSVASVRQGIETQPSSDLEETKSFEESAPHTHQNLWENTPHGSNSKGSYLQGGGGGGASLSLPVNQLGHGPANTPHILS